MVWPPGGGNITRCGFLNMSLSAHLGNQRLVLDLIIRMTATKLVKQVRQLVSMNADRSKHLERASFDAHDKVTLVGSALTHHLISGQQCIDVISRYSGERQHLSHVLQTRFFF